MSKEVNDSTQLKSGIIHIPGYKYVGFLEDGDIRGASINKETMEIKVNEAFIQKQKEEAELKESGEVLPLGGVHEGAAGCQGAGGEGGRRFGAGGGARGGAGAKAADRGEKVTALPRRWCAR